MTISFRPNEKRLIELLSLVGKEVKLHIESVGTLTENSVLMNVVLKINTDSLDEVLCFNRTTHIAV